MNSEQWLYCKKCGERTAQLNEICLNCQHVKENNPFKLSVLVYRTPEPFEEVIQN